MATFLYANGLGGTVDMIAVNRPFYGLDSVAWYVDSNSGSDSASGRDKQNPLATLRQAVSNASANDVIVLLDGHFEIVDLTPIALNKRGLVIVGCGDTAGVPNVRIINISAGSLVTMTVSAANVQVRNVRFVENQSAMAASGILVTAAGFVLDGCYFECGAKTQGNSVALAAGADGASIRDTIFLSTALVVAEQPGAALVTLAAIQGLHLHGAVFSDGTAGFSGGYAADFETGAVTDLMADAVSLLLGASMRLGASTTGYLLPTVTGGGAIDL